jgi:hypothetical protein
MLRANMGGSGSLSGREWLLLVSYLDIVGVFHAPVGEFHLAVVTMGDRRKMLPLERCPPVSTDVFHGIGLQVGRIRFILMPTVKEFHQEGPPEKCADAERTPLC